MRVNAYKTEHCGECENTYSVEIEYDPANEAERVEAQMTIIPYRPMLDFSKGSPEIIGPEHPAARAMVDDLMKLWSMKGTDETR